MRRGRTGAAADERAPAVEPDAPDVSRELREEVREDGLRRRGRREEDKFVACHGRRRGQARRAAFFPTITPIGHSYDATNNVHKRGAIV